jgi:hypothetical protein
MMFADPMLYKGVHVSLIGLDEARIREIGKEVSTIKFGPLETRPDVLSLQVAEKLNGTVVEAAK